MSSRPFTARGVACLLCGIVLCIAGSALAARPLLYIGVLLSVLPLLSLLFVRVPRRRGEVSRHISTDLLAVGETSKVSVRFDLYAPGIPRGRWYDTLPEAVHGDASGEYPDETRMLHYELEGVRRGTATLGPLVLRTADPFGLAQRTQAFGQTRLITVVPQVFALLPLPTKVGAAGGTAQTRSTRLGQGADNLIPRPYASGDSRRRIHWRATAHRGDLMVRQEEEEASPDAVVVLDRAASRWARAEGPGAAPDALFETAVSLCASAALRFVQDGYSVDVLDSAGVLLGALRGHEDDRDGLMVALASVAPRGEARDLRAVVGAAAPGPLVVITGQLSDADADRLSTAGAAAPMLLAAGATRGALAAAAAHGWHTAAFDSGSDLADAWAAAIPSARMTHG
ncbi:DUF58 domain-containing protein [Microbacterium sp. USHLN186]|uniref:DUF58 domain-containing protein n=1 Tax=Microbacterium sp. USHLN186 TaxID=3081286 RepID=UPI003016F297